MTAKKVCSIKYESNSDKVHQPVPVSSLPFTNPLQLRLHGIEKCPSNVLSRIGGSTMSSGYFLLTVNGDIHGSMHLSCNASQHEQIELKCIQMCMLIRETSFRSFS